MRLTDSELRHFKNVSWGVRFHRWFRWVFLAVLAFTIVAHVTGWREATRIDWLFAGAVYLLVAWPGLCRVYVFHTLERFVAADPEARQQLHDAGIRVSGSSAD